MEKNGQWKNVAGMLNRYIYEYQKLGGWKWIEEDDNSEGDNFKAGAERKERMLYGCFVCITFALKLKTGDTCYNYEMHTLTPFYIRATNDV